MRGRDPTIRFMADPARSPEPLEDGDEILEEDPNEVEHAWAAEIERRRRELDDGTVEPLTKDEFIRRLRDGT